jgi:hypothetical protein
VLNGFVLVFVMLRFSKIGLDSDPSERVVSDLVKFLADSFNLKPLDISKGAVYKLPNQMGGGGEGHSGQKMNKPRNAHMCDITKCFFFWCLKVLNFIFQQKHSANKCKQFLCGSFFIHLCNEKAQKQAILLHKCQ